jgi:toxin ParE1/3/4
MELVFDDRAVADLEDIFNWITLDSPAAAKIVTRRLFSSIELLISFPFMGHAGRHPGAFEWVVPRLPYVVVYEGRSRPGARCSNGRFSMVRGIAAIAHSSQSGDQERTKARP